MGMIITPDSPTSLKAKNYVQYIHCRGGLEATANYSNR